MVGPDHLLVTKNGGRRTPSGMSGRATSVLPVRLLQQSAKRLRTMSLTLTIVMIVAWLGVNLVEGEIGHEFRTPIEWGPPMLGIVASILIFGLARSPRLSPSRIITFGLAYEVIVSFSISLGHYWNAFHGLSGERLTGDLVGVSSVALWMVFFTVLIPARPRNALVALILSGSAVPVTMGILIRAGNAPAPPPMDFFFIFVFPYIITIVMCLIAARVIYGLGRDVHRAQEMGSYHLLDLIGRGGMGEVWRAKHRILARPAAIKLVRPEVLGGKDGESQRIMLERFEREAQATALMRSPHTIDLYDFGVSDEGVFYYVMELLEGLDIESLVQRFGPVPPERAIYILRQVCDSLGEAHENGLIHRDVKPANVYLCRYGRRVDFVKVLDFGLVKMRRGPGAADLELTAENVAGGTPAYMSPEQVIGNHPVDSRTDIYAVGCLAYRLLTGRLVFQGETVMETMMHHVQEPPVPPSERTEVAVPPSLDDVILSCLEKHPERRPRTADDLAERLAACETEESWTPGRADKWWDLHVPK